MESKKMDAAFIRETGITSSMILLNPNLECTPDAVEALIENQRKAHDAMWKEFEENCKTMPMEAAGAILSVRMMFSM